MTKRTKAEVNLRKKITDVVKLHMDQGWSHDSATFRNVADMVQAAIDPIVKELFKRKRGKRKYTVR